MNPQFYQEKYLENVKTEHFENPKDFFNWFYFDSNLMYSKYIFRGENSSLYELLPSALRKESFSKLLSLGNSESLHSKKETMGNQIDLEFSVLRKFYYYCEMNGVDIPVVPRMRNNLLKNNDITFIGENITWMPSEYWEIAALAQHYGLPTRLLDWSTNINTAIYFAAYNSLMYKNNSPYMVIWALNAEYIERSKSSSIYSKIKIIRPLHYRNSNLISQNGIFTLSMNERHQESYSDKIDRLPLENIIDDFYLSNQDNLDWLNTNKLLYKIRMPKTHAKTLLEIINRNGYSPYSFFPSLDGIAEMVKLSEHHIAF